MFNARICYMQLQGSRESEPKNYQLIFLLPKLLQKSSHDPLFKSIVMDPKLNFTRVFYCYFLECLACCSTQMLSCVYPQSFPFKYHFQIINLSKKNLPGDRRNRSVLSIKVCLFSKRTNICGKNILNSIGCYITYLMGKGIETQFFCSR